MIKKDYLKIALAAGILATTISTSPVNSFMGEPVKVYAATSESQIEKDNEKYINADVQLVEDYAQMGNAKLNTKPEGVMTVKGTSKQFKSGSDITKELIYANTVDKYLTKKQFYYVPGAIDTYQNAKKGKSTYYKFTAPCTGVLKFRWVNDEQVNVSTGASVYDKNGKVVSTYNSDLIVGGDVGNYLGWNVKKGETYTIRFASLGGDYKQKFEAFFIDVMDNNNGAKNYSQNKWYVYNVDPDSISTPDNNGGKIIRKKCALLNLQTESEVTVYIRDLTYAKEGWTNKLSKYYVYKKSDLDSNKNTAYKTINLNNKDNCKSPLKITFKLPAGKYYIRATKGYGTDFAFKYSVKSVATKKVSAPSVTKPYESDTAIKGSGIKGATVTAKVDNKSYTAKVGSDGKYSIKVPKLKKGATVKVTQKHNGVTSSATTKKVANDTFLDSSLTVITTANGSSTTVISGKCYKNTEVSVNAGGKTYKDKTTKDGKYSIKAPKLKEGAKITVTQKNTTGSKKRTKSVKNNELKITSISVSGSKTKISGKCAKNDWVKIKVGNKTYTDKTTKSGSFSVTVPRFSAGTKISVTQANSKATVKRVFSGNGSLFVKYYKPSVIAHSNSYKVTGKGLIKGSVVSVRINGKTYKGKVDKNDNYKVKTCKLKKGDKVRITIKNGKYESKSTTVVVK